MPKIFNRNLAKHKKNTMSHKIIITCIEMCTVPIVIIAFSIIFFSVYMQQTVNKNEHQSILKKTALQVQNFTYNTYQFSDMVRGMQSVEKSLLLDPAESAGIEEAELYTGIELNQLCKYNGYYSGIYIYGQNGVRLKSDIRDSDTAAKVQGQNWYLDVIDSNRCVWNGPADSLHVKSADDNTMSMGVPIIGSDGLEKNGVLYVEYDQQVLREMISDEENNHRTIAVVGNEGQILAVSDDDIDFGKYLDDLPSYRGWTYQDLKSNKNPLSIMESDMEADDLESRYMGTYKANALTKVSYVTDHVSGWRILVVTSEQEILASLFVITIIILGILIVAFRCYQDIAQTLAEDMVRPIEEVNRCFTEVENGNFAVKIEVDGMDEVTQLQQGFNSMVVKLDGLVDDVREKQKKLRGLEYSVLQMQIKPHFMYNTLDSIIWLAKDQDYQRVIRLTSALIKLYRIGLSRGEEMIPLSEEIEHVRSYLEIQKIRYPAQFGYDIQIPEELMEIPVPKLILQPLVENAIYHGIKQKHGIGQIGIQGVVRQGILRLTVKDDGAGMSIDKLEGLRNTIYKTDGEKIKSYGVKNVHQRIALTYGEGYGLEIISLEGFGTEITIRIPYPGQIE